LEGEPVVQFSAGDNAMIQFTRKGAMRKQDFRGSKFDRSQFGDHSIMTNYDAAVDAMAGVPEDARQKLKEARQKIETEDFSDDDRRYLVEQLLALTKEVEKPQEQQKPGLFKRYWEGIKAVAPTVAAVLSGAASLAKLLGH